MITNSKLTIFHKTLNEETRLEEWIRYNCEKVWWFGGKGANLNKGYDNANDVDVRVPYNEKETIEYAIGDILVKGKIDIDIETPSDLSEYEFYYITSINENNFGGSPHIHFGGK